MVQLVVGLNRDTKDKQLSGSIELEAMLLMVGLKRDTRDRSKARKQNVAFFKAGNLHRQGIAGQKRRHNVSLGSCRRALGARGGQPELGSVTETITLDSDSSDNESLQEMEEKLARMLERKFKRRGGHDSLE